MARRLAEVVVVVFEETSATGAAGEPPQAPASAPSITSAGGNDQRLSERASRSIPSHPSVHVVRVPRPLSAPLRPTRYRSNVIRR